MEVDRYAAGVEYFGKNYNGWQIQKSTNETVQSKVEQALTKIADIKINTICAGRTDSGVNALSQVIHFDSQQKRTLKAWKDGANSILPDDIKLIWVKRVSNEFHARFSAVKRTYKYFILNDDSTSIFYKNKTTLVKDKINLENMKEASKFLIGEKDFSSFRSSGCQSKTPIREIFEINFTKKKKLISIEISANAFLLNMVRIIIGTLLDFGLNDKDPKKMKSIIESRDRNLSGKTLAASGLYFIGPEYPGEFKIKKPPVKHSVLPILELSISKFLSFPIKDLL